MTSKERHEARYQRRKAKREQKIVERAKEYTQWSKVYGFQPIRQGYIACAKASKNRTPTQTWMSNLAVNTRREQKKLADGTWRSRGFNYFKIKERGKWRDIQSVHISEKGIQNTLSNNSLIPILRPHLIYDNGASLKGKGTDFALNRFTKHLHKHFKKHDRKGGIFFFDFHGYFANILNDELVKKVNRFVINQAIMDTYRRFVYAFGAIGLGLGSQVSQISAVFYPNEVDHFIKDVLGIHEYGRYMDDGYIFCESIKRLKAIAKMFTEKCNRIGIIMNEKKCRIIKLTKQFIFLKTRFFITETGKVIKRINREATKKERKRLKAYRKFFDMGLMDYERVYNNFHSWLLSLTRGAYYHIWWNMIRYFNKLFPEKPYMPKKVKTRKQKILLHIAKKMQRKEKSQCRMRLSLMQMT